MLFVFAGDKTSFEIALDPPASVNSVRYSLRMADGSINSSVNNLSVNNTDGAVSQVITVDGSYNTMTAPKSESRFLMVSWLSNGAVYRTIVRYVLVPFLPYRTTVADVRMVAGLFSSELGDDEIDITSAAVEVLTDIDQITGVPGSFLGFLTAGDQTTDQANMLIAYRALLRLGPTLVMRIAQMIASDTTKFQRLRKDDSGDLVNELREQYDAVRDTMLGRTPVVPKLFSLGGPRFDAIRGPLPTNPTLAQAVIYSISQLPAPIDPPIIVDGGGL